MVHHIGAGKSVLAAAESCTDIKSFDRCKFCAWFRGLVADGFCRESDVGLLLRQIGNTCGKLQTQLIFCMQQLKTSGGISAEDPSKGYEIVCGRAIERCEFLLDFVPTSSAMLVSPPPIFGNSASIFFVSCSHWLNVGHSATVVGKKRRRALSVQAGGMGSSYGNVQSWYFLNNNGFHLDKSFAGFHLFLFLFEYKTC